MTMMKLCTKCGSLSFYDPYFKKYVCSSCSHSEPPKKALVFTPRKKKDKQYQLAEAN